MSKDKMGLLKDARVYPDSKAKDAFLRKYRIRVGAIHYTGWDMIRSQIGYIRSQVWIISLVALAVGVIVFSRRGILFARIVCVGLMHLTLLLLLTILIGLKEGYGLAMTGSILTVPYLISSIVNMELERTAFGRKSALPGLGVAAIMAVVVIMAKEAEVVFRYEYHFFWYLLTAALIVIEIVEIRKSFHMDTDFVIER